MEEEQEEKMTGKEKLKAALWEGEYGQYRRARQIVERAMQDVGRR